jgi:hypothetical protein
LSADNIDTRSVLESIRELVSRSNVYIVAQRSPAGRHNRQLLKNVAAYVTRIFDTLGLISKPEDVGFPTGGDQSANVSLQKSCFMYGRMMKPLYYYYFSALHYALTEIHNPTFI